MGSNVVVGDLVDGKYRILRTIGEGGWGIVFEGENVRTFKRVAIKILRTSSAVTKDILTRFEREAQAAGRIGSDHIVEVYDLGTLGDGTHYMVMELLTGEELAARLRACGTLDPVAVARIVVQLLDGLKAAHAAGILHRDLKPENLFLVPTRSGEEFVKILDFGISKFSSGPQTSATMTGAVLGSPCYMAPEQARGLKQVDARTDLYAVGTLMFESLTGRVPFVGDNFNDLMFNIVLSPRPDPRELRPDLDPDMAQIVVKAMTIDPLQRYQSAEEMSAAVVEWLESRGISSVRAPELKRATHTTPRINRESSATPAPPPAPTPMETATVREPNVAKHQWSDPAKPPWSDATMPLPMPMPAEAGTPLVASSSNVRLAKSAAGTRWRLIAGAATATLVVAVAGGVLLTRRPQAKALVAERGEPPPTAIASVGASASPPPATSTEPARETPASETSVTPANANTELGARALEDSEHEGGSSSPAPTHSLVPALPSRFASAPARATKTGAAPSSPSPKATDAPPPPSAAATAAPAKPVSTVEGREIRTGL
jgi:serine/threonine-protein kinase